MKLKTTLLILLILLTSCAGKIKKTTQVNNQTRKTIKMRQIKSWAYQLQNPSLASLSESPYDLIVMDYSKDGTENKKYSAKEIALLHKFKKTVLCYFSIGEAESYRFYWQKKWNNTPPRFLGPENENWKENYKVKYWREDWWQSALKPYLDRIIEAGFDGVYLDIVDAYWFWHEQGMNVQDTADDMVKLIKRIADYCRAKAGPNFIICPQNGLGVFASCSPEYKKVYFETINMVGLESLLYNFYSEADRDYRISLSKELAAEGKIILDVEYIEESEYKNFLKKISNLDFPVIPYASTPDAALDKITNFNEYR